MNILLNALCSKDVRHCLSVIRSFANQDFSQVLLFDRLVRDLTDFGPVVARLPVYDVVLGEAMEAIKALKLKTTSLSLLPALNFSNEHDRRHLYEEILSLLDACASIKHLETHFTGEIQAQLSTIYPKPFARIKDDIDTLRADHDKMMSSFPDDMTSCQLIGKILSALASFEMSFRGTKPSLAHHAATILRESALAMRCRMDELACTEKRQNPVEAATFLVALKRASRQIVQWRTDINSFIDKYLVKIMVQPLDLLVALKSFADDDAVLVEQLLADHSVFSGVQTSMFNEATAAQDLNYVLKELSPCSDGYEKFRKMYDVFDRDYTSLVLQGLSALRSESGSLKFNEKALDEFILQVVNRSLSLASDASMDYSDQVVSLSSYLFAVWSLLHRNDLAVTDVSETISRYIMRPHAGQVVACWIMLNCECAHKSPDFKHRLVELKTGEGKSIVLGVVATILATLGYRVDVVCYSSYLSGRDERSFQELFSRFGVQDRVWYGTIKALGERILGDSYRASVEMSILGSVRQPRDSADRTFCPSVLLVDEVDVFFGHDVFGNRLQPVLLIQHCWLAKLYMAIWDASKVPGTCVNSVAAVQEALPNIPLEFRQLASNELQDMFHRACRVRSGKANQYFVKNDRVVYKDFDKVTSSLRYRHETVFAYVHEYEKGNISKRSMNSHVSLSVSVGKLSYAEVPFDYDVILGITGTLQAFHSKSVVF